MATTDELSKIAADLRTLAAEDDLSPKAVARRIAKASRRVGQARGCGAFSDPEFIELCEILDLAKTTALTPGQGFKHPYSEAFRLIIEWCCRELPAPRQLVFMLKPHDRLKPYERYDLIQGWVAPEYVETNLRALADLVEAQALTATPPTPPKYRLDMVPALDDSAFSWLTQVEMADREDVTIGTLKNDRNAVKDGAVKDTDGTSEWGVDRRGRPWRKKSQNAKDVRYAVSKASLSEKKPATPVHD